MFVYIRSAAFIIVVTQKLVLQQSKNVTAKCTETLLPPPIIFNSPCTWPLEFAQATVVLCILPPPRIQFSLVKMGTHAYDENLLSPVLQGMIQRIQNANNG